MAEYEYESGASTETTNSNTVAKSCKGLLYYSSSMKADSKTPICAGFTRSHPNSSEVYVDMASKEDRTMTLPYFRFFCVGYSAYADQKGDHNLNGQETETELPGCRGLMVRLGNPASAPPISRLHNRKDGDGNGSPQRRSPTSTNSTEKGWV
ncbi:hypothetical protein C2S51_036017 [Perilla frutescens var. frutescens]|nr:hypothetical protein C2S51_036017 [Perilla frutescens var. frutescens]